MTNVLIGIFTVFLVIDCLLLVLLVLVQLPKKEAGAGMAFGGGATDALFGAGSGNALTRITKWVATLFFAIVLILSVLYLNRNKVSGTALEQELSRGGGAVVPAAPTNLLQSTPMGTNALILTATNAPAQVQPVTNRPAVNPPPAN